MLNGHVLKTEADFENAIMFGEAVSITQEGDIIGNGHVLSQSYHVVKTEDGLYFKDSCVFTVCSAIIKNRF